PKEQAQIAQQARQPEKPKTNQNQSNKELEDIRAQLKEWKQTQERQQVESLRREKFSEVQDETNRAFQKFEATPADQQEFWKRYGAMVQNEAQTYMQNGMPLPQAMQKAQYNHSFNIAGEYALLMEDKLATLWSKKAQERNSPLRGIASPADKQGAPGVMPGVKERFLAAIKNEKSAEKRAQMYVEFGREFGEPNGGFFKSSGGI
ncbi:MAG TPA: hypothetical protein VNZ86_06320, partial [Bacteroidia bacterium]|nr:hypothetical protein [Bacteroidia bacterium]